MRKMAHIALFSLLPAITLAVVLPMPMGRMTPYQDGHEARQLPQKLSLRNAILLSLRYNPAMETAELTWVDAHFNLRLARYALQPHFAIGGDATWQNRSKPNYSVSPTASLTTSYGTTFNLNYSNNFIGSGFVFSQGATNFNISQPLLRGFGQPERTWESAITTFQSARMAYEQSAITTTVAVITAYRSLVESYNNINIQQRNLATSKQALKQTKLRVNVGQSPRSDIIQQETTYQQNELSLMNSKIALEQQEAAFLEQLGIASNARITIDTNIPATRYVVPNFNKTLRNALRNNPAYHDAQLAVLNAERGLTSAHNDSLWDLTASTNNTMGQPGGTQLIVDKKTGRVLAQPGDSHSFEISLNIPINDLSIKNNVVSAENTLTTSKINLRKARRDLYNTVNKDITQIRMQIQNIRLAEKALSIAEENLRLNRLSLRYGRTSQFQVDTLQTALVDQREQLVSQRIQYLNLMTNLRQYEGTTLQHWHIKLRNVT